MGHTQSWSPVTGFDAEVCANSVNIGLITATLHRTSSIFLDHVPLPSYLRTAIDFVSAE